MMITIGPLSRLKVETSLVTALEPHLPPPFSPASTPPPPYPLPHIEYHFPGVSGPPPPELSPAIP